MEPGEVFWSVLDPVCDLINIYEGPEVFLETYSRAPHVAGLLYCAHFCQSEICNGGFWQFFHNSTGVLAPEALEGFLAIGQNEVAATVREAMEMLGPNYLRERAARQELLSPSGSAQFEQLNKRFFKAIHSDNGGFEIAADRFAAQTSH